MRTAFQEFKRCLKPIYIEEVFDLAIFRPFAFLLVKAVYSLPITPNQVTISGIFAAVVGGILLWQGTRTGFLLGGLFYLIAVVFDCADGMLARLKGNGTKIGRILDGLFDYIATTSVMVGLAFGMDKAGFDVPLGPFWLVAIAGLAAALQSMTVDYAKSQFLAYGLPNGRPITDEVTEFEEELARLRAEGREPLSQLAIVIYLYYSRIQARSMKPQPRGYVRRDYFRKNLIPVRLWTLIGPGTHRALFILAAVLYQPAIYLWFAIVIGNAIMLALLGLQAIIKPRLKRTRVSRKLRPVRARARA
jgi:phosphatidylglycerophosphate synthase